MRISDWSSDVCSSDLFYQDLLRRSPIDEAVRAHVFARRTLDAGFTSVRSLGSAEFVDVALARAIDEGFVPGPRIQAAGHYIGSTGSHADINGVSPYLSTAERRGGKGCVSTVRSRCSPSH